VRRHLRFLQAAAVLEVAVMPPTPFTHPRTTLMSRPPANVAAALQ
jgi:hypothetical protein